MTAVDVALNIIYWFGCHAIVRRWLRPAGVIQSLLATVVAGSSLLFVGLQILSLVGQLNIQGVSGLTALVACAGGLSWVISRRKRDETPVGATPATLPPPVSLRKIGLLGGMLFVLCGWLVLRKVLRGVVLPVAPVSDAPIYHLYFAVTWFQEQTIRLVMTPFGELAAPYFPANGSLWFCWLLLGSGTQSLAKVGQFPFFVASALAVYGIARNLGAEPKASFIPAAMWASLPLCNWYVDIANVDLLYCFFFLASTYFLLELRDCVQGTNRYQLAVLAGLGLGCALGTKTIAVAFSPLVIALLFWSLSKQKRRGMLLLVTVMAALVPCVFWYGRNLWLTGNPLYPLAISVADIPILPGWYDKRAMLNSGYHLPTENLKLFVDRLTLVCDLRILLVFLTAISVAVIIGPWYLFRQKQRNTTSSSKILLCGLMAIAYTAIYWYVLPYNSQERFLAPALGIGLAPLAVVLSKWRWTQCLAAGLIVWHLFTPQWVTRLSDPISPALATTPALLVLPQSFHEAALPIALSAAVLFCQWIGTTARSVLLAALIVAGGMAVAKKPLDTALSEEPLVRFYPPFDFGARMYPAWDTLQSATGQSGGRVAYAGTNLPYYLQGMYLHNRVSYINVNAPLDWQFHDYQQSLQPRLSADPYPQWYRENADYEQWNNNLKQARIEYLFVARENMHGRLTTLSGPAPLPIEYEWAMAHPDRFELLGPATKVGELPWAFVFRVKSDDL